MTHRNLSEKFLESIGNIKKGELTITLPSGKKLKLGGYQPGHRAHLTIKNNRFFSMIILQEDIGFTRAYMAGYIECDDLINFARLMFQNMTTPNKWKLLRRIGNIEARIKYLFQHNTISGSKKNIPAHYDLGNDFYRLWLDKNMNYSSALYHDNKDNLVNAQLKKNQRILDIFDKTSGRILEIGCGWGAFAELATSQGDYDFHGISLSHQQLEYAKHRLHNKATIEYLDYRNLNRTYDRIASIEMFEAVGKKFWNSYFYTIYRSLNKKGRAVIATIFINDKFYKNYEKSADMIRTFIFPGGHLPSYSDFLSSAKKTGLKTVDIFHYGLSYAKTLKLWLENFDKKYDEIKKLGYHDDFIRLWRCYLAFCAAGFAEGRIGVKQVAFEK
ncbi:MAG: class I SAM-dependent methyltransferase [Alphaproteobacteria bacterium]